MADPGVSPAGAPTPKIVIIQICAENCMKMKEFGPPGEGARPWHSPLDPPIIKFIYLVLKCVQIGSTSRFLPSGSPKLGYLIQTLLNFKM